METLPRPFDVHGLCDGATSPVGSILQILEVLETVVTGVSGFHEGSPSRETTLSHDTPMTGNQDHPFDLNFFRLTSLLRVYFSRLCVLRWYSSPDSGPSSPRGSAECRTVGGVGDFCHSGRRDCP